MKEQYRHYQPYDFIGLQDLLLTYKAEELGEE